MKTSTQLKALLRNISKKSNVESEVLLRNFMLERFLERIAVSDYKFTDASICNSVCATLGCVFTGLE